MQGYPPGGYAPPPKRGPSTGVVVAIVLAVLVLVGVVLAGLGFVILVVLYGASHAPPPGPAAADAGPTVVESAAPSSAPPPVVVAPPAAPKPTAHGAHAVDFKCPVGSPPHGAVRGGCLCGDLILGTACGDRGFSDVVPTATGCRFTCE